MQKFLTTITVLLFWCSLSHAQIELNGDLREDTESGKPVPDTRISVVDGPGDLTDSQGKFRIKLPRDFVQRGRIIFHVSKEGWIINDPVDGHWNLPDIEFKGVQTKSVLILPKGSIKLWSHDRIENYLSRLQDELARAEKEGDQPRPVDFTFYLDEWADKFGFTADEVKAEFDKWVKQAQGAKNKRTAALAEIYRKNFAEAARYFEEAAIKEEAELRKSEEAPRLKILSIYTNRRDAGNAWMLEYRFKDALKQYQQAEKLVNKNEFLLEFGEIKILIGNVKSEIGLRVQGESSKQFFKGAVTAYRSALEVYTRTELPQDWAATQNKLGDALRALSIRTGGEEGAKLLAEAVAAYRSALEVYTRTELPQDWAATQNKLGSALSDQSISAGGEKGAKLLAEAVASYRSALEVFTRTGQPQDWAITQKNLGNALSDQSIRTGGKKGAKLLAEAVAAYRSALEVYTRTEMPQYWAMTQNNLGNALSDQGIRTGGDEGAKLLAEAVAAFRSALEVYTRTEMPKDWAMTQNNLAEAYSALKDWPNVAACYTSVLEVYPNYEKAYHTVSWVYQNMMYEFSKAYELNKGWVANHGDDLIAKIEFTEKQFTTSRFEECYESCSTLLMNNQVEARYRVVLRSFQIGSLFALKRTEEISDKLKTLSMVVSKQAEDFQIGYSSNGVTHFIDKDQSFPSPKEWLIGLFHALEGENRDEIMTNLEGVERSFVAQTVRY